MRINFTAALFLVLAAFSAVTTYSQETELRVVDEVIAQVNDSVITLSKVNREAKAIVDSYVKEGKTPEEAQRMVDEKRGELIANMINEQLLLDKGKELGLEKDVDAAVNERFLQIMKQYNLKDMDALHAEMERQGADPRDLRDAWARQSMREMVIQTEVQQKEFWKPSGKEVREYFDKHQSKFVKPETMSFSEIFLSFAGRDEAAVREKAKQLLAQLRGGADFLKVAMENSDRPDVATTKGKVEALSVKDLHPKVAEAFKGVKVGGYGEPVELDTTGVSIVRLDERTAAGTDAQYNEREVRLAMLQERASAVQKEYMANLRSESVIRIGENYRPLVSPILYADERKEKPDAGPSNAKPATKPAGKQSEKSKKSN